MVHMTCSAANVPAAPSEPEPEATAAAARSHTVVRASTRRCPAGRRSRWPVSRLGAGADKGPITASNTADCAGVIANR